jgi:hypothetical protein
VNFHLVLARMRLTIGTPLDRLIAAVQAAISADGPGVKLAA